MLRSVANSSQSSSLPHLLSAIHDIPHNILLPPARPASQSRAVVLESSCIQCTAVAEKVLHYLSLFTLASLALIRAITLCSAIRSTLSRIAVVDDAALPLPNENDYLGIRTCSTRSATSGSHYSTLEPRTTSYRPLVRRGATVAVLPWSYDINAIDSMASWAEGPTTVTRITLHEWRNPILLWAMVSHYIWEPLTQSGTGIVPEGWVHRSC
jgi:hypothetical protein